MPVPVSCPACGTTLRAPDAAAGKRIRCPRCKAIINVPYPISPEEVEIIEPERPTRRPASVQAPRRKNRTLLWLLGATATMFLFCCGGCLFILVKSEAAESSLAQADKAWDAGKHDEAAAVYEANYSYSKDKQKILTRIAEFKADKGDGAGAAEWINKGLDSGFTLTFDGPAAQASLAQTQKDRAERDAQQKADQEARAAKQETEKAQRKVEADERASKQEAENALNRRWGDSAEASVEAKNIVKSKLNFPAEASFYWLAVHDPPQQRNQDGSWTVWGGVTGKNAFGVKEKLLWEVDLIVDENHAWKEIATFMNPDPN